MEICLKNEKAGQALELFKTCSWEFEAAPLELLLDSYLKLIHTSNKREEYWKGLLNSLQVIKEKAVQISLKKGTELVLSLNELVTKNGKVLFSGKDQKVVAAILKAIDWLYQIMPNSIESTQFNLLILSLVRTLFSIHKTQDLSIHFKSVSHLTISHLTDQLLEEAGKENKYLQLLEEKFLEADEKSDSLLLSKKAFHILRKKLEFSLKNISSRLDLKKMSEEQSKAWLDINKYQLLAFFKEKELDWIKSMLYRQSLIFWMQQVEEGKNKKK